MIRHLGKCVNGTGSAGRILLRRMRGGRRPGWLAVPLALVVTLAGAIDGAPHDPKASQSVAEPGEVPLHHASADELSVLTYNVKGLPWPLASGRPEALGRIGDRLAAMRREGRQPQVVVLQEAFTPEAKAIGHRAGYPFIVEGPYTRSAPTSRAAARRDWHLGETQAAAVDSGLVLLSDLPVRSIERVAFAPEDCAGYDCLAAKGVLLVELEVPGRGPVLVATTHLNCQGASGAPKARTTQAFGRQAATVGRLLARAHARGLPIVIAGDFNQGQRPQRATLLHAALDSIDGRPVADSLTRSRDADPQGFGRNAQLAAIREHARDLQFAFDGGDMRLAPVSVEVPFGQEPEGEMLSDHMGYTVRYRMLRSTLPTLIAAR